MELMRREAERQREVAMGKVGPDGNLVAAAETPMVNGYKEWCWNILSENYILN